MWGETGYACLWRLRAEWIPAYAGMTVMGAGGTREGAPLLRVA